MSNQKENKVIIFSAPSGSGKTTVVKHLLAKYEFLEFSVSATTRKQRPGEVDGKDYYFFTEEEFREKLNEGAFLEHEEVYKGLYYGTLKSEVERIWAKGHIVIFDVDVVGGIHIKQFYGDQALAVFLRPPSIEILHERLLKRETEVEHQLKERIEKAHKELQFESRFDVVIVNDQLIDTFAEAERRVEAFKIA